VREQAAASGPADLPVEALHRALIHGLLDEEGRGAPGVDDEGTAQEFVHLEDLGADLGTGAAVNTVSPDDMRDGMGHGNQFSVFSFQFSVN
jgi:hypothetical protein